MVAEHVLEAPKGLAPMTAEPSADSLNPPANKPVPTGVEANLHTVTQLLSKLDETRNPAVMPAVRTQLADEDRLAFSRLGVASGLFSGLRAKHSPTASHSLRVAFGLSSWASSIGLEDPHLLTLEISALLHDIGKLGVPDAILTRPTRLSEDEAAVMGRARLHGLDVLRSSSYSSEVFDIVRFAPTWYDGKCGDHQRSREQLPIGSRMLAIIDAFDSMTTDHVYRRAMTTERALGELAAFAGTQFDARLVSNFTTMIQSDHVKFMRSTTERWLSQIEPSLSSTYWGLGRVTTSASTENIERVFEQRLISAMTDGVIFLDQHCNILTWNRAMERLTGILAPSICRKRWLPSMLELRDANESRVEDADCPVNRAMHTQNTVMGRYSLLARSGRRCVAEIRIHPMLNIEGQVNGAILMARDLSSEVTLEEAIETLHAKATQDPLTRVANRAEFDRVHQLLVMEHLHRNVPCSLIICDLDYFKRINDQFGHPAGDEALMVFASLLKRVRRPGDLVARYGGEEFVYLCAECDGATAARIAEELRCELENTPMPMLNSERVTASFGVTEIQPGDTPETMLRRADRALLKAKEAGRNRVVHIGNGLGEEVSVKDQRRSRSWWSWFRKEASSPWAENRRFITRVPLDLAIEKLRGFISDHQASIVRVDGDVVAAKVDAVRAPSGRRKSDRPIPFAVELKFKKLSAGSRLLPYGASFGTQIDIRVEPIRLRDRRRSDVADHVTHLFSSLKAYFIAELAPTGPAVQISDEHDG